MECFQSYTLGFAASNNILVEMTLDGDNLGVARYYIKTVGNGTLKVIQNPSDESRRTEYARQQNEITFEFLKRSHIFGWSEFNPVYKNLFALNVLDKTLTVLQMPRNGVLPTGMLNVLKCR